MGARESPYPLWFYLPALLIFFVLFLLPTFSSFYYSLTRWTLFESEFIGLDNFRAFFEEPALTKGLTNTLIYGFVTSGLKVVLGMLLAVLLTAPIVGRGFMRSVVFFPTLVSWIGVGLTFTVLLHPSRGLINNTLGVVGIEGPGWLVDTKYVLLSIALVDVWKGVGSGHRDLHRRDRLDPARVLRGRAGRRRRCRSRPSGTSSCRSPVRPR